MSMEELDQVKGRQWEKWEDVDVSFLYVHWYPIPHADDHTSTDQARRACGREPGGGDDHGRQIMHINGVVDDEWQCTWSCEQARFPYPLSTHSRVCRPERARRSCFVLVQHVYWMHYNQRIGVSHKWLHERHQSGTGALGV